MPEISRFFGIVIRMYYDDHLPPQFHAEYSEHKAVVEIQSLAVIGGYLPPRAQGLVVEWATQHREELLEVWNMAMNLLPLPKIMPLA